MIIEVLGIESIEHQLCTSISIYLCMPTNVDVLGYSWTNSQKNRKSHYQQQKQKKKKQKNKKKLLSAFKVQSYDQIRPKEVQWKKRLLSVKCKCSTLPILKETNKTALPYCINVLYIYIYIYYMHIYTQLQVKNWSNNLPNQVLTSILPFSG